MRLQAIIPVILLALLALLLLQLWSGRGSLPDNARQRQVLAAQQAANQRAQLDNERLASEVRDLQNGLEMVEERARSELGMVKPNEILVQVLKH
ncbi:MAG: septum formation initiator family protein [Burkholderiaceae bacterium]|nr:septum formation initiator family protein [Burkholderiaceae bacterium]